MKVLISIHYWLLILLPYSACLYRKVAIQIHLLFISIFEALLLVTTIIIVIGLSIDSLAPYAYFYNITVWISVFINIFLIFMIWIIKKKVSC